MSSIQVYFTSVVVHAGQHPTISSCGPTIALQSSQRSAGNCTLCLLLSRIDLLPRTRSARLLDGEACATIASLRCISFTSTSIHSFYFPFSEVAPEPTASNEPSIGVAPSALSFFSVRSRWCSITLRFLKYVTCIAISIVL